MCNLAVLFWVFLTLKIIYHLCFISTFFLFDFQHIRLKESELTQANRTAPEADEALTVFQLQPCGQTAEAESHTDSWMKAKHREDVEALRLAIRVNTLLYF